MQTDSASWQVLVLSLLVAAMPACFAMSSHAKNLPMAVLSVTGLLLLVSGSHVEVRERYRLAWPVAVACALRLLYDIGNFIGHRLYWPALDLPAQTLLFLLIAAVFALPLHKRIVDIGFSLSTIFLGGASLFQRYVQGADRPYGLNGGTWASIEFAMYLLVLVLLSLQQALRPGTQRSDRLLHSLAVIVGLYGAVLTQSRGPLLAFAPVFLGLMLWYARRYHLWRRTVLLVGLVVAGMLAVTTTLHHEMIDRLADVPQEIASYSPTHASGAVRERLAMWHVAWRAFREHPLGGIGLDQFGTYVREQVAADQANAAIAKYVHPHSEYLEAMVAGGIPALLVLLVFFAVPLVYFARRTKHPDDMVATAAISGLAVVGMYGLCAFSDNVFYRAMPQSLYLFLVLGLAVSIGRQLRNASLS